MCMYYCECESLGGIGIGAYTGMERSQQATTGQWSDNVTRKEKEQGISARLITVILLEESSTKKK